MLLINILKREYGKNGNFQLDHVVEKFKCSRVDVHALEGHDMDLIPPFSCQFSLVNPHMVAVADEDGGISILDTNQAGIQAVVQTWRAHENAIFDIEWLPGENKLLTASGDQKLILWDVEKEEELLSFKGHNSSVRTVKHRDKFVFASGARDGHVMIWDTRSKAKDGFLAPINTIKNAHAIEHLQGSVKKRRSLSLNKDSQQSVTTVIFQDDYTLLSTGSVDGTIKVWDLRKTYTTIKTAAMPKHKFLYGGSSVRHHGFSHMVLDSTKTHLFASCMDNVIYMYNTSNFSSHPVKAYKGHKTSSFYIRLALSPDDMYLLSGSSDANGYIWQVNEQRSSPMILKGHSGEVSGVDWCHNDFSKLMTLGDDCTVRLWRLFPGKTHQNAKLDQEIIAGTCEKTHKEKGINVHSQTSPLTSPKSPHKGAMVKPSAVSMLSPSLHTSLLHLPSNLPSPHSSLAPSPRLISPSITRWFRTSAGLVSPPGHSPRKLEVVFSPRKSGTPGKLPFPSTSNVQNSQNRRGQKRKLTYNSESENHTKKRLINNENHNLAKPDTGTPLPLSPVTCGTGERVLRNHMNRLHTPCQKKLEFGGSTAAQDDCSEFLSTPKKFSSPTVNLPNYVFDPRPRTPRAKLSAEAIKETEVDWLTKIRIDLASETPDKSEKANSAPCQSSPKTPVSTTKLARKLRSSSVAKGERSSPRLSRTPTQGRKISHYFSVSPVTEAGQATYLKMKRTDSPKVKNRTGMIDSETVGDSTIAKMNNLSSIKKTDCPAGNSSPSKHNVSPSIRHRASPSKRTSDSPTRKRTNSPSKNRLTPSRYTSSPLAKKS